ncbi:MULTISPECIES: superoxide dismutase family protein [unclassified Sporosarcina]|uniref:superoxide dismutase family protein n=1 Tax=unclassified Sporosarcina TaxID=2647733 RepID=UPI00203E4641|nr:MULTISPECIES: superoxide dismutase family protein [unclassified Sporosarcina]
MWKLHGVILGAILLTAGCSSAAKEKVPVSGSGESGVKQQEKAASEVNAPIINTEGESIGSAVIRAEESGVAMDITVTGLTPGKHGIHIHEHGVCTAPDFKASAGGHFNPGGKEHGFDNPKGYHAGDLENIEADDNGNAEVRITTDAVTLELGKENSLLDGGGKALVIHEGEDDYKTDPAGNSGTPFACAEITSENLSK